MFILLALHSMLHALCPMLSVLSFRLPNSILRHLSSSRTRPRRRTRPRPRMHIEHSRQELPFLEHEDEDDYEYEKDLNNFPQKCSMTG